MKTIIEQCDVTSTTVKLVTRVVGDIHSGTGMLPEEKIVTEYYIVVDNKIVLEKIEEKNLENF